MTIYILTIVSGEHIVLRAFVDLWAAMTAATTVAQRELAWVHEPYTTQHVSDDRQYFIDEVPFEGGDPAISVKASRLVIDTVPATDAQSPRSVQYFLNGVSMGKPMTDKPYRQQWTRPAGQEHPMTVTAEVVHPEITQRCTVLVIG